MRSSQPYKWILFYGSFFILLLIAVWGVGAVSPPQMLSHQGGAAYDVVIEGNLAYVAFGPELQILDISNPVVPALQGKILFSSAIRALAVSGGYIYAEIFGEGLHLIDARNPAQPMELVAPLQMGHPFIHQNRLFATTGSGLGVFDISDPANVIQLGSFSLPYSTVSNVFAVIGNVIYLEVVDCGEFCFSQGYAVDISDPANPVGIGYLPFYGAETAVSGNYLYLATSYNGLQIFDISNPANPAIVITFATPNGATDINVVNNYAYLIEGNNTLRILDVSDLEYLHQVGVYSGSEWLFETAVFANHVYMGSQEGGLQIVNATNPTNPVLLTSYDTGGTAHVIAAVGPYVYTFGEIRRHIWDMNNPAQPVQLQSTQTISQVKDISVDGTKAAVVDGDLHLFDLSNPAQPQETGYYQTPGLAYNVVLNDDYAYVADQALRIIDTQSMTETGSYEMGMAQDIAVVGNYAYVAEAGFGFRIIDISNSNHPLIAGFYPTTWGVNQLKADGNRLYAVSSAYYYSDFHRLYVLDVTNPLTPIEMGFYESPMEIDDITLAGNLVYLTDSLSYSEDAGGMQMIDMTDPANPVNVGFYGTWGEEIWDVVVSGNYAYVAAGSEGLRVVDVSNPLQPILTSQNSTFSAKSLVIVGDYAYITGGMGGGFRVVDISDPANPTLIGSYDIDTYNDARGVAVVGNYAYVVYAGGYQILGIFDISDPANPVAMSFLVPYTPGVPEDVAVVGNYAYVADQFEGLRIINVSNPANPIETGFYDVGDEFTTGVKVIGNYAYLANGDGGLRIVNISNPVNPVGVGVYDTSELAQDVVVTGNYAYVSDGAGGLQVVNISNPGNPVGVGGVDTTGEARNTAVSGNYAYIADTDEGLRIIEITNPATPTEVAAIGELNSIEDVVVAGNYAYLASGADGLNVLDVSDPANPIEVSDLDLSQVNYYGDLAYTIAVAGSYAYLDGEYLLWAVNMANPTQPIETVHIVHDFSAQAILTADPDHLYITNTYCFDSGCFGVWDISNPASPVLLSEYGNSFYTGATVIDDTAYLAGVGLDIVDVTIPTSPSRLGNLESFSAGDLVVAGNYAYVADCGFSALHILDVSNPAQIVEVGTFKFDSYLYNCDIAHKDQYVMMMSPHYGEFLILDVSDPESPLQAASVTIPGYSIASIKVSGHFVYIAVNTGSIVPTNIRVIDIWNPAQPALLVFHAVTGNVSDIVVTDEVIYTANDENGWYAWTGLIETSRATITPEQGGELIYTDADGVEVMIQVPPGAVSTTGELVYRELPYEYWQVGTAVLGQQFDLSFAVDGVENSDYAFQQPITINFHYPESETAVLSDESALVLQRGQAGSWIEATTTCTPASTAILDITNNTLTVPVCQLDRFALVGPTHQVLLPVVIRP